MRKKEECAKTKIRLLFIFRHGIRGFHGKEIKYIRVNPHNPCLKEIIKCILHPLTGEEAYIHR